MGIRDLTAQQIDRIDLLMRYGWSLDKIYGDGPVSLSKVMHGRAWASGVGVEEFAERVSVFVDIDGKVHPPRTSGTMVASSELYDLKVLGTEKESTT